MGIFDAIFCCFEPVMLSFGDFLIIKESAVGKCGLGCISDTVRYSKFYTWCGHWGGCWCAISWCAFDLIFGFALMTLSFKILYRLYLGKHKV